MHLYRSRPKNQGGGVERVDISNHLTLTSEHHKKIIFVNSGCTIMVQPDLPEDFFIKIICQKGGSVQILFTAPYLGSTDGVFLIKEFCSGVLSRTGAENEFCFNLDKDKTEEWITVMEFSKAQVLDPQLSFNTSTYLFRVVDKETGIVEFQEELATRQGSSFTYDNTASDGVTKKLLQVNTPRFQKTMTSISNFDAIFLGDLDFSAWSGNDFKANNGTPVYGVENYGFIKNFKLYHSTFPTPYSYTVELLKKFDGELLDLKNSAFTQQNQWIVENKENLKTIYFDRFFADSMGFDNEYLFRNCKNLEVLNVTQNAGFNSAARLNFENCPKLNNVRMYCSHGRQDYNVDHLFNQLAENDVPNGYFGRTDDLVRTQASQPAVDYLLSIGWTFAWLGAMRAGYENSLL